MSTIPQDLITDLEIVRDKIESNRNPLRNVEDDTAKAIENELWFAQQRVENALSLAKHGSALGV